MQFCRCTKFSVRELGLENLSLKAVYPNVRIICVDIFGFLTPPRLVVGCVLTGAKLRIEWRYWRPNDFHRGWFGPYLCRHLCVYYCRYCVLLCVYYLCTYGAN